MWKLLFAQQTIRTSSAVAAAGGEARQLLDFAGKDIHIVAAHRHQQLDGVLPDRDAAVREMAVNPRIKPALGLLFELDDQPLLPHRRRDGRRRCFPARREQLAVGIAAQQEHQRGIRGQVVQQRGIALGGIGLHPLKIRLADFDELEVRHSGKRFDRVAQVGEAHVLLVKYNMIEFGQRRRLHRAAKQAQVMVLQILLVAVKQIGAAKAAGFNFLFQRVNAQSTITSRTLSVPKITVNPPAAV